MYFFVTKLALPLRSTNYSPINKLMTSMSCAILVGAIAHYMYATLLLSLGNILIF